MQCKKIALFSNDFQVEENTSLPAYESSSDRIKKKDFLSQLCKPNLGCISAAHSTAAKGIECLCVVRSIFHLIYHCHFGAVIPESQLIFFYIHINTNNLK